MEMIDYNGEGKWSRVEILARYAQLAAELGITPRDLSPREHVEGDQNWIYPVMDQVIEGIEAGDAACVQIGVEFICEDEKFSFGKTLKSNTARALRRTSLTEEQKDTIRTRVFAMLEAGHIPHEFKEYAKLVKKIGYYPADIPKVHKSNEYARRFEAYFKSALIKPDAG